MHEARGLALPLDESRQWDCVLRVDQLRRASPLLSRPSQEVRRAAGVRRSWTARSRTRWPSRVTGSRVQSRRHKESKVLRTCFAGCQCGIVPRAWPAWCWDLKHVMPRRANTGRYCITATRNCVGAGAGVMAVAGAGAVAGAVGWGGASCTISTPTVISIRVQEEMSNTEYRVRRTLLTDRPTLL